MYCGDISGPLPVQIQFHSYLCLSCVPLYFCCSHTLSHIISISQSKEPLHATVLEVYEKSVLVEPFEGEEELLSSDQVVVNTDVESTHEIPEMEEGTTVRIVYNGDIAETYPAQTITFFSRHDNSRHPLKPNLHGLPFHINTL